MERINQYLAQIGDKDDYVTNRMVRGIFTSGAELLKLMEALILKDVAVPILVSNSVRHAIGSSAHLAAVLKICESQLEQVVKEIGQDEKAYIDRVTDITRTHPRLAEVRKGATGMHFMGGDDERAWGNALAYGLQWAHDYESANANIEKSVVMTIGTRNKHRINLRGRSFEYIRPVVVQNEEIHRAMVTYGLKRESEYRISGEHMHLLPTDTGAIEVFDNEQGVDETGLPKLHPRIKIGEIGLVNGKICLDQLRADVRACLESLLSSSPNIVH